MTSLLLLFIYLLFVLACPCIAWQILPLIPFSTINSISISVNNSNFTFVFLNMLAMLILVQTKNGQDQVHIFHTLISKVFKYISKQKCIALNIQIMILTKIFLFQMLPIHFKHAHSLYLLYFLLLIRCKRLL